MDHFDAVNQIAGLDSWNVNPVKLTLTMRLGSRANVE